MKRPNSIHTEPAAGSGSTAAESLWERLEASVARLATVTEQRTDPAALAHKLNRRAQLLRGRLEAGESAEAALVYLAFHKGLERFGIPLAQVLEVQSLDQFCPVPGTPEFLLGVIQWRGAILTLLDLGKFLGIPETGLADLHAAIIVEAAGRRLAVVAREIEDIVALPVRQLRLAPELPPTLPPEWVLGVGEENRLILRMDLLLQDPRLSNWRME